MHSITHTRTSLGLRCSVVSFCIILRASILRRYSNVGAKATKVRTVLHLWLNYIHGKFRDPVRSHGTPKEYVPSGTYVFHNNLHRIDDHDAVSDLYERWAAGLHTRPDCIWRTAGGLVVVLDIFPTRWLDGAKHRHACNVHHASTGLYRML